MCLPYDSTLPCSIAVVFDPSTVGIQTTATGYTPTTFEILVTGEALAATAGVSVRRSC